MTEGQWLWLMVHMAIDNDEALEKICDKCKSKLDEHRCNSCGDKVASEINPNFDESLFEELKKKAN